MMLQNPLNACNLNITRILHDYKNPRFPHIYEYILSDTSLLLSISIHVFHIYII